jgi:hypothetical protein
MFYSRQTMILLYARFIYSVLYTSMYLKLVHLLLLLPYAPNVCTCLLWFFFFLNISRERDDDRYNSVCVEQAANEFKWIFVNKCDFT